MKLHFVNIVPLLKGHANDTADNIKELASRGEYDETAFSFTLVPEGNPVLNKAECLGRIFTEYQKALHQRGLKAGMLIQATMGHGWVPDSPAVFQRFRRGNDLNYQYTFCPLDHDFQKYIYDSILHLVSLKPDFMMVDDDCRMFTGRGGCVCPLHVAGFNQLTGRDFTAEALVEALKTDETLKRQFDEYQRDTLVEFMKIIRSAIDAVNPKLPCSFCACSGDLHHAPHMANALAAPDQEIIIRINNGRYLRNNPADTAEWLMNTCRQKLALGSDCLALTEADTCPQNRYSTDCAVMHSNIALALLQGFAGAKLWVTRMSDFEPASGRAYRDALIRHAGQYQAIRNLNVNWCGFNAVLVKPNSHYNEQNWGCSIFAKLGLPFHYDNPAKGASMLSGNDPELLSDDELKCLLSGKLILDGKAAASICRRGFGEYIGCSSVETPPQKVSFETFTDKAGAKHIITGSPNALIFKDVSQNAETLSSFYHKSWAGAEESTPLGPGCIRFNNSLGGTVVSFGAFIAEYGLGGFFLLSETRKLQLTELLDDFNQLPVYYAGDQRVICQYGISPSSGEICYFCNFSNDILDSIPVNGSRTAGTNWEILQDNGTWQKIKKDDSGALPVQLLPLHPMVFRISNP